MRVTLVRFAVLQQDHVVRQARGAVPCQPGEAEQFRDFVGHHNADPPARAALQQRVGVLAEAGEVGRRVPQVAEAVDDTRRTPVASMVSRRS